MKTPGIQTIYLSAFFLLGSTCFFSCGKETIGPYQSPNTFSYQVENNTFSGGLNYATYESTTNSFQASFYSYPVTGNYMMLNFSSTGYLLPGTYRMGNDTVAHRNISMCFYTNASHPYTSTHGILTITRLDTINNQISGTFQFTGSYENESKNISGGTFDYLNYLKR